MRPATTSWGCACWRRRRWFRASSSSLGHGRSAERPRKRGGIARRRRDGLAASRAGPQRLLDRSAAQANGDVAGVERVARADRIDGLVATDRDGVKTTIVSPSAITSHVICRAEYVDFGGKA